MNFNLDTDVLDVLERAEDGATAKQIARELGISREPVDHDVHPLQRAIKRLDHRGHIYPLNEDGATVWHRTRHPEVTA